MCHLPSPAWTCLCRKVTKLNGLSLSSLYGKGVGDLSNADCRENERHRQTSECLSHKTGNILAADFCLWRGLTLNLFYMFYDSVKYAQLRI